MTHAENLKHPNLKVLETLAGRDYGTEIDGMYFVRYGGAIDQEIYSDWKDGTNPNPDQVIMTFEVNDNYFIELTIQNILDAIVDDDWMTTGKQHFRFFELSPIKIGD